MRQLYGALGSRFNRENEGLLRASASRTIRFLCYVVANAPTGFLHRPA
jgi:hypothetical protein